METTHSPACHPHPIPAGEAHAVAVGGSRAREQPLRRGPEEGPRPTTGRRPPGLGAAGTALTEAGAGGVQLLREEAVVAEALQGVPGGDDRHHHQPAAQHVQEPAHPPGRHEACPQGPGRGHRPASPAAGRALPPGRLPHPALPPPAPAAHDAVSTPIGHGRAAPSTHHADVRASAANRIPRRQGGGPAPPWPRPPCGRRRKKRPGARLICCACAVRVGRGHRPSVVVVTGKRREGPRLLGRRVRPAGRGDAGAGMGSRGLRELLSQGEGRLTVGPGAEVAPLGRCPPLLLLGPPQAAGPGCRWVGRAPAAPPGAAGPEDCSRAGGGVTMSG